MPINFCSFIVFPFYMSVLIRSSAIILFHFSREAENVNMYIVHFTCNCDFSYVLAKADIAFYKHIN